MTDILQIVLIVFAGVIGLLCAVGVISPAALMGLVRRAWNRRSGMYGAVVGRLVLGALLIFLAPSSRFPGAFQVLGGIAVVAAVVIAVMGRNRVDGLIEGFASFSPVILRVWLLFGLAFAGFLIYSVW